MLSCVRTIRKAGE